MQIVLALAVELNLQERRRDQTAPVPRFNLHAPESPRARHRRSALTGKASAATSDDRQNEQYDHDHAQAQRHCCERTEQHGAALHQRHVQRHDDEAIENDRNRVVGNELLHARLLSRHKHFTHRDWRKNQITPILIRKVVAKCNRPELAGKRPTQPSR